MIIYIAVGNQGNEKIGEALTEEGAMAYIKQILAMRDEYKAQCEKMNPSLFEPVLHYLPHLAFEDAYLWIIDEEQGNPKFLSVEEDRFLGPDDAEEIEAGKTGSE